MKKVHKICSRSSANLSELLNQRGLKEIILGSACTKMILAGLKNHLHLSIFR